MLINLKNIILTISLSVSVWASEALVGDVEKKAELHAASPLLIVDALLDAAPISPPSASVDGYANLDTVFERVIGLGHWCLTKGQINKYFAPELHLMATKKGHADLFDWLYIHDYFRLAIALEHKLEDFFERKDFYVKDGKSKKIYNRLYEMSWPHLFGSNLTGGDTKGVNSDLTEQELDLIFPSIKEKINYLKDKFISAKKTKTLYIISHPRKELSLEALVHVRDSLTIIRAGDKNFCILFIPHAKTYDGIENIIVREAKNLNSEWDGADSVRWKQILDEFKFTPDIWK